MSKPRMSRANATDSARFGVRSSTCESVDSRRRGMVLLPNVSRESRGGGSPWPPACRAPPGEAVEASQRELAVRPRSYPVAQPRVPAVGGDHDQDRKAEEDLLVAGPVAVSEQHGRQHLDDQD